MKKLLIIFLIMFLFSCKKDPCYECKTYTYSKPYEILIDVETEIVCEDELGILKYQTDHYVFTDSYYSSCECKKR